MEDARTPVAAGIALLFLVGAGCGSTAKSDDAAPVGDGGLEDVTVTHPSLPPLGDAGACTIETGTTTPTSGVHVPICTALDYPTVPPAGGPHYPYWAQFGIYDTPVDVGLLVHDLEHGAVVLWWNCPGCTGVEAALRGIVDGFPEDPLCTVASRKRLVMVPWPALDVPIAASSWGNVYRATCLDTPGLTKWVADHYAHSPENLCAPGLDLRDGDGGVKDPCAATPGAAP
jgi:hypothetical protein